MMSPMRLDRIGARGGLSLVTVAVFMVGALAGSSWAVAADPFYENLLAKGTDQYNRRDFVAAARTLRLACFGFLEEPERLADALVRLGLAQAAGGLGEMFVDTFRRVVEVEERFGAYAKAPILDPVRAEFERQAVALVPASTLRTAAGFSHLAAPRPGTATPVPSPAPETAGLLRPASAAPPSEAGELRQAQALLAEGKVVESYALAKRLADSHPNWREAQFAVAEAAYRLARWLEAVAYFGRGGDPGEEQPLLLFYWAVSLYESGDRAKAVEVMRRALPRVKRTEYVEKYRTKILGPP